MSTTALHVFDTPTIPTQRFNLIHTPVCYIKYSCMFTSVNQLNQNSSNTCTKTKVGVIKQKD